MLIARSDDARSVPPGNPQALLAVNDVRSQSGWAAPEGWARANGMQVCLGPVTGSHVGSIRAVADGSADWAGIDAVTWRLLSTLGQCPDGLRVFAHTEPTPGLPYIMAKGADPKPRQRAIRVAIDRLPPVSRAALSLYGIVEIPRDEYCALALPLTPVSSAYAGKSGDFRRGMH